MDVVKSAEMLEKFPAGCVPCFEAKDGTRIHQSAAIATYGEFRSSLFVCAPLPLSLVFRCRLLGQGHIVPGFGLCFFMMTFNF